MMAARFRRQPHRSLHRIGRGLLSAREARDFLAVAVIDDRFGIAGDYHAAMLALDDVADAHAPVVVHLPALALRRLVVRQAAHFKEQRGFVSVIDNESVGGFGGILVAQAPANGLREGRNGLFAQKPAGNIQLVRALVPIIAVAVVPKPMPVVVNRPIAGFAARWFVWGRATPEIILDVSGHRLRPIHRSDTPAGLVTKAARQQNPAQAPLAHILHRLLQPS